MSDSRRKKVENFLEGGAGPVFEAALDGLDEVRTLGPTPAFTGERIGPYRILREIGQGGMSVVYLAERDDGEFEHQVAIKVLRQPGRNPELLGRFRVERQILANLVHPHIANILDGGISESGWPYLVMEFIDGKSLLDYCGDRPLTEKLRLFQDVCAAVQHAHQHLVVHRDLKPSNILVTADGAVKLLDFGIAKLLSDEPEGISQTLPMTATGVRLMTPEYAAPEQLKGGQITTGCDVYSLGVLLYQILCGRRPYDLSGKPMAEMEKLICEIDPESPGSGSLDLDIICLKALRKEPEHRYATARDMADDLQRFSEGLPVLARPTTARYRMSKYIRRNRLVLSGSALMVVLSLSWAVTTSVQQQQTAQARDAAHLETERAVAVTDFLLGLFEAGNPRNAGGDSLRVADLLTLGADEATAMASQPTVQAQMLTVIGRAFDQLGQYEKAENILRRAASAHRSGFQGAPDAVEAETAIDIALAQVLNNQGRNQEGVDLLTSVVDKRATRYGDQHLLTAYAMSDLGAQLIQLGQYVAAESLLTTAMGIVSSELTPDDPNVVSALNNLCDIHRATGDYGTAHVMQESVLVRRQRTLGPDHLDVAISLNNLAVLERRLGKNKQAEERYRQSIAIKRRVYGGPHADIARSLDNMGIAIGVQGRYDDAEPVFTEAVQMREQLLGTDHPSVGTGWHNLAVLMSRKGDYVRAAEYGEFAVGIGRRQTVPPANMIGWMSSLATSYAALGQLNKADQMALEADAAAKKHLPPNHPDRLLALVSVAKTKLALADYPTAEKTGRESLELALEIHGAEHRKTASAALTLGEILRKGGSADEAVAFTEQSVSIRRKILPANHPRMAEALHEWGLLLTARGEKAAAITALTEALSIRETRFGAESTLTAATRDALVLLNSE